MAEEAENDLYRESEDRVMEEFRSALESVNGSYEDFVLYMLNADKQNNSVEEVKDYLRSNPDITEEDVLIFYHITLLRNKAK